MKLVELLGRGQRRTIPADVLWTVLTHIVEFKIPAKQARAMLAGNLYARKSGVTPLGAKTLTYLLETIVPKLSRNGANGTVTPDGVRAMLLAIEFGMEGAVERFNATFGTEPD